MNNTNTMFMKGKINFLLDGNAGSSGKGKFSEYLVDTENVDFLITSNSANASHTVVKDNKEYVFKALPSGSIHHEKLKAIYIVDGASFEVSALLKEIEMTKIPREKVKISPRAGIITQIDKDYEAGICSLDGEYSEKVHNGTVKTGTTASGSGAVLAKKVLRNSTLTTAKDVQEIADMICSDISEEIMEMVDNGLTGFFEIGQGFPLSNNHKLFAPYTTSRNVTVSSALNDAFLPPYVSGNVIINFRTYPIKIHSAKYKAIEDAEFDYTSNVSYSDIFKNHTLFNPIKDRVHCKTVEIKKGDFLSWFEKDTVKHEVIESPSGDFYPDQKEISWEELNKALGNDNNEIFECTTLTKLPRRIATFSKANMNDAIAHNRTGHEIFVTINFANYVDKTLYKSTSVEDINQSEAMSEWINQNLVHNNLFDFKLALIGTGEDSKDIINLL